MLILEVQRLHESSSRGKARGRDKLKCRQMHQQQQQERGWVGEEVVKGFKL
jgi:hypothetical protein